MTDVGTGSIGSSDGIAGGDPAAAAGEAPGAIEGGGPASMAANSGVTGSIWTGKTATVEMVPSAATWSRAFAPASATSAPPSSVRATPLALESGSALPGWSASGLLSVSYCARSATLSSVPSAPTR